MGTPIKRLILNDTSYNPINNFRKNPTTMKFLLIVALLPCALAQCPEEELPECQRADMLCGGRPREDGCLSSYWCMYIDPYAKCSSKKTVSRRMSRYRTDVPWRAGPRWLPNAR